jgi:transposase, IS5 family
LLELTSRVVGQAKRHSREIASGVKRPKKKVDKAVLQRARQALDTMIPRVQQVMQQARVRVFKGNTHAEGKLLSVFEPNTEVIRKGKASKPTEFGKMAKIQEAENQIVTRYEVFDQRPSDSDLLVPAIEEHQRQLGCTPRVVAADAGFFSAANETAAEKLGVKRVSVPSHSTKSEQRKKRQKTRWFKTAQKWRTGCEGRISVLKQRHGLNRCRLQGFCWHSTLGRPRSDRRQLDQHRLVPRNEELLIRSLLPSTGHRSYRPTQNLPIHSPFLTTNPSSTVANLPRLASKKEFCAGK